MQPKAAVALLAEGGDRNMDLTLRGGEFVAVALLAEGGDRNWYFRAVFLRLSTSPSSRRAGIEIKS